METANVLLKDHLEDIPSSEQWLYDNKEALESVLAGIEDSKAGRVQKLNLDEL
ncbi:MAG: hypothetical protein HQK92_13680 [Nitrospirae bacterium]|nr:hypothetical protein [Nitrospirota bacterium]